MSMTKSVKRKTTSLSKSQSEQLLKTMRAINRVMKRQNQELDRILAKYDL